MVSPEVVALSLDKVIKKHLSDLKVIAEEYADEIDILVTEFTESGFWVAKSVSENLSVENVAKWIERSAWKIYLQKEHMRKIGSYGSESVRISKWLPRLYPDTKYKDWFFVLDDLESKIAVVENRSLQMQQFLKTYLRNFGSERDRSFFLSKINDFRDEMRKSKIFDRIAFPLGEIIDQSNPSEFVMAKKINDALQFIHDKTNIDLKLIRALKFQITER